MSHGGIPDLRPRHCSGLKSVIVCRLSETPEAVIFCDFPFEFHIDYLYRRINTINVMEKEFFLDRESMNPHFATHFLRHSVGFFFLPSYLLAPIITISTTSRGIIG
jgi:hypothetical protein